VLPDDHRVRLRRARRPAWLLALLIPFVAGTAAAQTGEAPPRYRVEILLLDQIREDGVPASVEQMGDIPLPDWLDPADPLLWPAPRVPVLPPLPDWLQEAVEKARANDQAPAMEPQTGEARAPAETLPVATEPTGSPTAPDQDTQSPSTETPSVLDALKPVVPMNLPAESGLKLASARDRLLRSGRYRVLALHAWQQAFPPDSATPRFRIHLGDHYAGHHEVEGTLQILRRRYLHVAAELYHIELPPESLRARPEAPWGPLANGRPFSGYQGPANEPLYENFRQALQSWQPEPQPRLITWLRETRRMRSGELHYLGSPTLGLLVYIEPLEAPEPAEADTTGGQEG